MQSPFVYSKMDGWLKERETEVSIIKSYINEACAKKSLIQVVAPEDFDKVLFDPQYEQVWAFVLNSLGEDDPYLISLGLCLKSEKFAKMQSLPSDLTVPVRQKAQPWYRCPKIEQNMRASLEKFLQCASDTNYPFIISYIHYPYNAGASVRWYKGGVLCCVNYLNIFEPELVDIGANTMTFRAPVSGAPQAISYLKVADGDQAQMKKVMWPKEQELLVVLDLLPSTQYELWVDTEKDHIKMFTVVTKPN
ncbi:uncharacterized protein [Salminus brasiliensis]|uniref:uncharacterized protein n=1 Tax=Salminus brasiliensis TaxID=930266 RepID=UPI003B831A99